MSKLLSISKVLALTSLLATLAPCDTLTITISGVGSGNFGDQPFANKSFQFTFFTTDTANVSAPPCCAGVRTTPSGTPGTVTIADVGAGTMDATGDQAIFVNPSAAAAGIWHYNSPDFLTVSNPALSHYDLTDTLAPVTGKTFFYTIPLRMSDRHTALYFTSVSDVSFSVQRNSGGGKPAVVSVSPDSATVPPDVSTLFTFVVSDAAGTSDLQGLNILFSDPPSSLGVPDVFQFGGDAYACWVWYQRSTRTLSLFAHDFLGVLPVGWVSSPLGASGSVLTSSRCSVDTTQATVHEAGNFLTLALPVRLTREGYEQQYYPSPMSITVNAVNNEKVDTGYQHAGQVTQNPTSEPGFNFYITPANQDVAIGATATYRLKVVTWGGFNDAVSFSARVNSTQNTPFTFDPPTVRGAGETTLTVSTVPSVGEPQAGYYLITTSGKSSSGAFDHTVGMAVESGPPTITVSDHSAPDATKHFYGFEVASSAYWLDAGVYSINGLSVLIGPVLDGRNACWFFSDGNHIWLAGDDGLTWSLAGPDLPSPAGNSQCTIEYFSGRNSFEIAMSVDIAFKPGFSPLNNKIFVRSSNPAGFDTGYTLADVRR